MNAWQGYVIAWCVAASTNRIGAISDGMLWVFVAILIGNMTLRPWFRDRS